MDDRDWARIRSWASETLRTEARGVPFKIVRVGDSALEVRPLSPGFPRHIARSHIARAAELGLHGDQLTPSAIEAAFPTEHDASYIVVLLRRLQESAP